MRVLKLSWEYPPQVEGGLGRHVAELTPALTQQGVEVHIVTPVSEPTFRQFRSDSSLKNPDTVALAPEALGQAVISTENGVDVHRVLAPLDGYGDIYSRVTEVNRIIEDYVYQMGEECGPCELIHIHDWLASFAGIGLKEAWNCPLIVTIHATERGRVRGHLSNHLQWSIDNTERNVVHEADRVIVCSEYMCNELQSFFQVPPSKLDVVPNGVDITGLQNHENENLDEFRARYADPDDLIVFTVSRLVYEKGVHRLVEAVPRILADCPAARIIIAGKGPESENLKRQAESLGCTHRVNFIGFVSDEDRNRLFAVADCAVFPSLYEPFGIVALEAMALGCPVVVSDVGGFSEVVTHKETGITVFSDDPESIAWGVLHTLKHPKWARKHAAKARQSVAELFNWTRIAILTKEVYQRVLEKST